MDVIDWARNIPVHDLSDGRGLCRVIFAEDFLNALKDLPSAQPEIIRCKECKEGTYSSDCTIICKYLNNAFSPDDYCSYGERRTDEIN